MSNKQISAKWEVVEDFACSKRQRLVQNGTGKIIGEVTGSNYLGHIEEWFAVYECRQLGRYVTEDFAKKAVEEAGAPAQEKGGSHEQLSAASD